jgi:hypothetical protein
MYYAKVIELTQGSTTKRAEVTEALAFMAKDGASVKK